MTGTTEHPVLAALREKIAALDEGDSCPEGDHLEGCRWEEAADTVAESSKALATAVLALAESADAAAALDALRPALGVEEEVRRPRGGAGRGAEGSQPERLRLGRRSASAPLR